MKKIFLLSLLFAPLLVFAQNEVSHRVHIIDPRQAAVAPVSTHKTNKMPTRIAYVPATITAIGTTVYELQTNGAIAKRLQIYDNGKMSYVWIKSDDSTDQNYTNRYSGYNSFDGSSWVTGYGNTSTTNGYEGQRNGWPNIGEVTTNGNTYEVLSSHYAAAGSATYAGGIFWNKNSGIGKTDFSPFIDASFNANRDSTTGVLWPRMATSGNRIYMIGTYQDYRKISGVENPIVYFCYNTSTNRFESKNITLPGYDSTRYGTGSADEYSIDARGQYVAIVTGGTESDLALWKSSDSGKTFTKTIINNFAEAPFIPKVQKMYTDTAIADDGTCAVALDNNGVAHVTYTPIKTLNATGDSGVSAYTYPWDSLTYWNDKDQKKINIGGCVDYEKVGVYNMTFGGNQLNEQLAGYGHSYVSFSNIALDPSGNIFVIFSAPHTDDQDFNGNCYRHVYCSVFNAAKGVWMPQQDVVQTWQLENIYATVARDANDNKIHFVYMQHPNFAGICEPPSGTFTSLNQDGADTMIYEEVSTADLLAGKVGLIDDLGINQNLANNLFSTGSIYPNPVADKLNLSLNLTRSSTVTVKLFNMLGEQMEAQDYTMLPSGKNNLQFSVNNLPSGVYLCNISAGGYTTTERVVVER